MSLILFGKILQLFLMMLMGWGIVKSSLLKSEDSRVLSTVLIYLVSPCVIFRAFMIEDTGNALQGLVFTLIVGGLIQLFYILFTALITKPLKMDMVEQATSIYSNASFLVVPLVESMFGKEYVIYTCGYILVQTVLLWTHGIWMVSGEKKIHLKKILTNVNVIAVLAGVIFLVLGIHLPQVVEDTIGSVAGAVGPLGMFLAGMIIAGKPLKEVFRHKRDYLTAALRLLVCPALAIVLVTLGGAAGRIAEGKTIVLVVLIAAMAPANTTVISQLQLYNRDVQKASRLYVITTISSIATMPVMAALYDLLVR